MQCGEWCNWALEPKHLRRPEPRCLWDSDIHGGDPINGCCPCCGGEVELGPLETCVIHRETVKHSEG